jgi:acetyl-CoA C-acetyltransferase
MTEPVYILGGWQSDFAERAGEGGFYTLLESATLGALEDAGLTPADIEVAHIGNLAGELTSFQAQLGGLLVSIDPEFHGLPTSRHEAACASGSVAGMAASAEIEARRYDVALVVGAEILRNVGGQRAAELVSCAGWAGQDAFEGQNLWPQAFADVAAEYDTRYGIQHEHLGRIAEVNFHNARFNPSAQTRDWELPDQAFGEDDDVNPIISGHLRKMDCGRITDGSAGVILASSKFAADWARARGIELGSVPRIKGWGHTTAPSLLAEKFKASRDSEYVFPHVRKAAVDAMTRAGLDGPAGLDSIEVHDCFSISEYAAIDHFGITEPGKSWQAVEDGRIERDGTIPINPSGGLLGLGHPVGATGVRMLLDSAKQVTGSAGEYQVDRASNVATLNIGGSFTTVATFVVGVDS